MKMVKFIERITELEPGDKTEVVVVVKNGPKLLEITPDLFVHKGLDKWVNELVVIRINYEG